MTGSQTDRVSVPLFRTVVTLLHRIATPLFLEAIREPDEQTTFMDAWLEVRRLATRIDQRRSLAMQDADWEAIGGAFRMLRTIHHCGPTCPVRDCPAAWMSDVNLLLAEELVAQ